MNAFSEHTFRSQCAVGGEGSVALVPAVITAEWGDCLGTTDACGVCGGDNSTCLDCNGDINGSKCSAGRYFDFAMRYNPT